MRVQIPMRGLNSVNNALAALTLDPSQQHRKDGLDWHAEFNSNTLGALDVDLGETFHLNSVVCSASFSPDGKFLAVGYNSGASIYRLEDSRMVVQLGGVEPPPVDNYVRSLCFSPNGMLLVTGSEDGILRVWNNATGSLYRTFPDSPSHPGFGNSDIYAVAVSTDGHLIASGGANKIVTLNDLSSLEISWKFMNIEVSDGVCSLATSSDCQFIAAGLVDGSIVIWNISGSNERRINKATENSPDGHKDAAYSISFSPDGSLLFSGSLDHTVKAWDFRSASVPLVRTYHGPTDYVVSVSVTRDSKWLLAGSKDRSVYIWNISTGLLHLKLSGHKNTVISVAASPTEDAFVTASGDMTVRKNPKSEFKCKAA
ncbi:MAG: general transcription repressor [Cirrosporium novae-zelandiae]|nr:MAG: general transcription repressor [Cirrosporium novae-zelandiae]